MTGNIGTACFRCCGDVELICTSSAEIDGDRLSKDICNCFDKIGNVDFGTSVFFLCPYETTINLIVAKTAPIRFGGYLAACLSIPYGLIISGEELNGIVLDVLLALETNRRDHVEMCLNSVSSRFYEIGEEQIVESPMPRKTFAYRRVGADAPYAFKDILANIFVPYYRCYDYVYLTSDNFSTENSDEFDDLTDKALGDCCIVDVQEEKQIDNYDITHEDFEEQEIVLSSETLSNEEISNTDDSVPIDVVGTHQAGEIGEEIEEYEVSDDTSSADGEQQAETIDTNNDDEEVYVPVIPEAPNISNIPLQTDKKVFTYTSKWLKQHTNIHGWLSFYLFSIALGGLISAIFPIVTYDSEDYGGNVWLGASDVVSGFIILGIAIYTIYLFVNRKPNAFFWGIAYVVIIFLLNILVLTGGTEETTGFLSEKSVVQRVLWGVVWFLYLILSSQVKEVIPKRFRKVSIRDWGILASTISIPVVLLVIGVVRTYLIVNVRESQEEEMLSSTLADNEHTDGRIVFTTPEGFMCEEHDVDVEGTSITLFSIKNDDGINCTMCSDYDDDISISNFDSYWDSWKDDAADEYPMSDESRGTINIRGNTCLYRVTKFNVDGIYVYWRYYMLFDKKTGKVFVASFYDRNESTDYVDELLYSIRFK